MPPRTRTRNKKDYNVTPNSSVIFNKSVNTNKNTTIKKNTPAISSLKTDAKNYTKLIINRPRRLCRLPSRFDDHILTPNKVTPLQPINASTPIQQSRILPPNHGKVLKISENLDKAVSVVKPARRAKTIALKKVLVQKTSPDTNNNAKSKLKKINNSSREANGEVNFSLPPSTAKKIGLRTIKDTIPKKIIQKIPKVQVLGNNKLVQNKDKEDLDVYNFTFDPDEEPQPQKKKRKKRTINKSSKVTKPKAAVTYKSVYNQNISKALAALKNVMQHSKGTKPANLGQIVEISEDAENAEVDNVATNISAFSKENQYSITDVGKTTVPPHSYASIRIEDIAADIEPSIENHDINYSPVNSPQPKSPTRIIHSKEVSVKEVCNTDPLNLQEDLSFFDDIPVASSSMNTSVRHPLASPWRVEFGNLPIKWHSNTYMKPNMTPAVESSFICSEDSNKKKHVYTNMLTEENDPEVLISKTSNLKQPTLMSFIKEVVEKKAKIKKRKLISPNKALPILENIHINDNSKQVENDISKDSIPNNNKFEKNPISNNCTSTPREKPDDKEMRNSRRRKNDENMSKKSSTSPQKQNIKDCTYFGFDESENQDLENISPNKMKNKAKERTLRPRTALQEVNGPLRGNIPVAVKSKAISSVDALNKVYEEPKSAAVVPHFPVNNVEVKPTNFEDPTLNDDSQSVHLFEDIEVIHHAKPTRKSYGKAKKVAFYQQPESDSNTQDNFGHNNDSTYDDDFGDLTFEVPNVKERKKSRKKPKKLMSKKEAKEAEEWAAGFNSMCEEVEEFPLVFE